MERASRAILFVSVIGILLSCSVRPVSTEEYVKWVENEKNACLQKKTIGKLNYLAMYKPLEYVIIKENNKGNLQHPDSLSVEFSGMEYYTIKMGVEGSTKDILLNDISSQEEYYERINYYTVNAAEDVYLVQNQDTFPCELYHYERTYGVSPYNNILLGFATPQSGRNSPSHLHFNDRVFNSGLLIFTFDKSGIPTVKID